MPDGPLVRMASGGSTGLLEATCRGLRHTLLLFGGDEGRRVGEVCVEEDGEGAGGGSRLRRYADVLAVVHVSRHYYLATTAAPLAKDRDRGGKAAGGGPAVPMEALYDDGGKVAEAFGLLSAPVGGGAATATAAAAAVPECLFLVRPDGYVAVRAVGWGVRPVVEYLARVFPERAR
jgi:hypothetical protein